MNPMTYYKYSHFLMQEDGAEYEETYMAGTAAPCSGIYAPTQGPVRWRLAVKSQYE
jgi:hypothetical protein